MDEAKALRKRVIRKGLAASAIYILCWVASILVTVYRPMEDNYYNWLLYYRILPIISVVGGSVALAWKDFYKLGKNLLTIIVLWEICIVIYSFIADKYIYPSEDSFVDWYLIYHNEVLILMLSATLVILLLIAIIRGLARKLIGLFSKRDN